MLIFKLAAAAFVAVVLYLILKKEQPAFAFLVSAGAAAGLLLAAARQVEPLVGWLQLLDATLPGREAGCLLRVLGVALVAQLAADICREGGMPAAATAAELCGRVLALMQALPMLQQLFDAYAGYLQ